MALTREETFRQNVDPTWGPRADSALKASPLSEDGFTYRFAGYRAGVNVTPPIIPMRSITATLCAPRCGDGALLPGRATADYNRSYSGVFTSAASNPEMPIGAGAIMNTRPA